MRSGVCTVQQALTTEAASVLKHSLSLAKRRGHAQVTPLHVAATLLTSTREATGLFRRACLKSHPLHPNSHPLQCRALELCFNVALNRLPTIPQPSSGPIITTHPSLSNALIAALKRAQTHQRRGCIEQQQHNNHHQQQQPLLAVKVELEQLIISILDDPSVSRVMREAGFSSTCIKNNLEEDTSCSSSSTTTPSVFGIIKQGGFWHTHFMKPPVDQNPALVSMSSQMEDLRLVIDALLGKNKKRTNTVVVVGDSVSYTEGLVSVLMGRVEKQDVPEELRSVQFIKLHLSSAQLQFMSRNDVEMRISDLKRRVSSLTSERRNVIVYLGDMKWAVREDDDNDDCDVKDNDGGGGGGEYRAVKHVIHELGRLQSEWRSFHPCSCRVWFMATSTYQTYMRCQIRQPSLEVQWGLQAVTVPSGGLSLSLHVPSSSCQESGMPLPSATITTTTYQHPIQTWEEAKPFYCSDEQDKFICCADCTSSFEKESRCFTSDSKKDLPFWLQPRKHHNRQQDALAELKRKWSSSCQRLHHHSETQMYPPLLTGFGGNSRNSAYPSLPPITTTLKPSFGVSNLLNPSFFLDGGDKRLVKQELTTSLDLGCRPTHVSESSSAMDGRKTNKLQQSLELCRRLKENIPWQSQLVQSISDVLSIDDESEGGITWMMIKGNDGIGKRRLLMVIADHVYRSSVDSHGPVRVNAGKSGDKTYQMNMELIIQALQKQDAVVMIEEVDCADAGFVKFLTQVFETGSFTDDTTGRRRRRSITWSNAIFILVTKSDDSGEREASNVIGMKLQMEGEVVDDDDGGVVTVIAKDLKRKAKPVSSDRTKNLRKTENSLDLNVKPKEEDEDAPDDDDDDHYNEDGDDDDDDEEEDNVLSDLTHETNWVKLDSSHTKLFGSTGTCYRLDSQPEHSHSMSEYYISRLNRAFEEHVGNGEANPHQRRRLHIDQAVVEEMVGGSGSFLVDLFEKWVEEVFQASLNCTVKNGGNVRLCLDGKMENMLGYKLSCLPCRIHAG